MIKLPGTDKKIIQVNQGEILGDIWSSFNLDLTSNLGKIRFSPRGLMTTTSTTPSVASLGVPTSFSFLSSGGSNDGLWAPAGAKMYKGASAIYASLVADSTTDTPTDLNSGGTNPDSIVWDSTLYVTGNQGIYKLAGSGGTWSFISGGNGTAGSMVAFANKLFFVNGTSQVAYTNGTTITKSSTAPNSTPSTINLGEYGGITRNTITCLRASSNRIWIATINREGGKGRVYEWDGADVVPTRFYVLESAGALSMVIKDDVPWIVDVDGRLLAFNGGAFVEKDRFPVKNYRYLKNPLSTTATERFLHFNGMSVQEDRILILVNNQNEDSSTGVEENMPSGVWEYGERTGLYHKYSFSAHPFTSTGAYTDYGFNRVANVGALATFKSTSGAVGYNGSILAGLGYYSDATTVAYGTFVDDTNDTETKIGYIVTPQIHSAKIQDTWNSLNLIHREYLSDTDTYQIKYRTSKEDPILVTGTWTSATTFTTTTNILGHEGDEIEVLNGVGSGFLAHITKIDGDVSLCTVTMGETAPWSSGTCVVRLQKWINLEVAGRDLTLSSFPLDKKARWVQFKILFWGSGKNEIDELQINNTNFQ